MIRRLIKEDYFKGFLDLINFFTRNPEHICYEDFCKKIDEEENSITLVIEENEKIIGTGKILIEKKFHNNFSKMGHIEDIVVSESYRGKGYGKTILKNLIDIGKKEKCYKIILCCSDHNIIFYKNHGFTQKGNEMSYYV